MSFLLTIEGMLAAGAAIGLLIGFFLPFRKAGCNTLLIVPAATIAYIAWWQSNNPEALRSTSGLDYFFGPLWPSAGAFVAYFVGSFLNEMFVNRGD